MGAYDKVYVDPYFKIIKSGTSWRRLNLRTLHYYRQARDIFHTLGGTGEPIFVKGSYIREDGISANTHGGGGAGDTYLTNPTERNHYLWEKALRMCMFAAWDRLPIPGVWDRHNHAGLLGDRDASNELKSQYSDFYVGRTGLKYHRLDPESKYRPPVIFNPVYPIPSVNLGVLQSEAKKTSGWKRHNGVERYQRALNKKLGTDLKPDGTWGPRTARVSKRWERSLGVDNPNEIPGEYSARLLGAGRFNLKV